jgi:hypothetical protein
VELAPRREELHYNFLSFCASYHLLDFAAGRYATLAAEGDADLARKFLRQIFALSTLQLDSKQTPGMLYFRNHLRKISALFCFMIGLEMALGIFGRHPRHFWLSLTILAAFFLFKAMLIPVKRA